MTSTSTRLWIFPRSLRKRSEVSHRRRRLDVAIIAISAPVWVPVMVTLCAAVLITSGRPVFFRQQRVGLNGETFTMIKFRSMRTGKNPLIPDPDRITRIGAVLRRTSLDELPQLLNVIRGEMSLVGPRPVLATQLTFMSQRHLRRHQVLPGMTGLAQINGRNTLAWDDRFELDLHWAQSPTLGRYLLILFRTINTVITGSGTTGHDPNDRLIVDLENHTKYIPTDSLTDREHPGRESV